MGRLNCLTCCFEARRKPIPKTKEEAYDVLKNYQIGIYALLIIQLLIVILWITLSYVNGFSLYVVDPSVATSTGWAHSVSHLGLWFVLELLAIWLGSQITWFSMEIDTSKSIESALRRIIVYLVAHIISMIADIIHIVLTGIEIGDKESTFYVQNWGFLIAFLVGHILYFAFIKTWLIYRCVVYYKALEEYAGLELVFGLFPYPASSNSSSSNDVESNGAAGLAIRTPLLEQLYKKRQNKK
jgi:hypothetical protein